MFVQQEIKMAAKVAAVLQGNSVLVETKKNAHSQSSAVFPLL